MDETSEGVDSVKPFFIPYIMAIKIKFRGKRKDNNQWVFGNLVQSKRRQYRSEKQMQESIDSFIINDDYFYANDPVVIYFDNTTEVIPETVGQFTGRTSKNGVDIYEGDIFKRVLDKKERFEKKYEWADFWLIEYLDNTCGFTTTCIGENHQEGYAKSSQIKRNSFSTRFDEMDVCVGNIHEKNSFI